MPQLLAATGNWATEGMTYMEHATLENTRCDASKLSEADKATLTEYLTGFLAPVIGETAVSCPCCGAHVYGGGVIDALLSTFTWGLAHGDGFCSRCKWPIRMYHFVKLEAGEKRMTFPLAYRCYEDEAHAVEIDPSEQKHERLSA